MAVVCCCGGGGITGGAINTMGRRGVVFILGWSEVLGGHSRGFDKYKWGEVFIARGLQNLSQGL